MRDAIVGVDVACEPCFTPAPAAEATRLTGLVVDRLLHDGPDDRQQLETMLGQWIAVLRVAEGCGHRFIAAAGKSGTDMFYGQTAADEDEVLVLFERMNREIERWRGNHMGQPSTSWTLQVSHRLADRLTETLTPLRRH